MAEMDNYLEINQNFDTIKTLLNSIRAQGILNTSDVDKLLSGINAKLEKINTEEDIDLIKIFLSELKQNFEERHSILISKFGAIESLFSNLLKNSSEMPKSTDIKELFDIVATNLSVFSREVVSQKETLTDITLRLDALRSDDSQKKDIIKNIALLKPDLERLNNGFDSIVISLNDNFKTIIKTITTIDKTEYLDRFADNLKNIEMSSNTVLSALQMLDKKAEQVDDTLHTLVTKEDIAASNERLLYLTAQTQELTEKVTDISDRYQRIDNLADKVDASVNIIVSLKTILEEAEEKQANVLLEQLRGLEAQIETLSTDTKFSDFRLSLESILQNILEYTKANDNGLNASVQQIQNLQGLIESIGIQTNFENLLTSVEKIETGIKSAITEVTQTLSVMQDANVVRILNDISSGAETLDAKLNQAHSAIAVLCEKNFASIFHNIDDLKKVLSQIDENSISANNAIFSSITDRLTLFENSLRSSLDLQEANVSSSAAKLIEQVENIKNLAGVLDYKVDSSIVEAGNLKVEFSSLKNAIDDVLALDFVTAVKDLRVDLYASKQEMVNVFDSTTTDFYEKLSNDLYGKYELLISKLESTEDEIKCYQAESLSSFKPVLEKISDSLLDILSYVSEKQAGSAIDIDAKIAEITNQIKENNLNYVESVRDVVDVIRVQVENNLDSIEKDISTNVNSIKNLITDNSDEIRKEVKYSYSKLLEIQDAYNEIKEIININNSNSEEKFNNILASADSVKSEFESRIAALKTSFIDKITALKQDLTCENLENTNEVKVAIENSQSKISNNVEDHISLLRNYVEDLSKENDETYKEGLAKIVEHFESLKTLLDSLNGKSAQDLDSKVNFIIEKYNEIKDLVSSFDANTTEAFNYNFNNLLKEISNIQLVLEKVDENVDSDMTRQLSIIESNFESLVSQMTILFDKSDKSLSDKINLEFQSVSEDIQNSMNLKLEDYKLKIEETFGTLKNVANEQSGYIQSQIEKLNEVLKLNWEEQSDKNLEQIEQISIDLKTVIDENIKLTAVDYVALKNKISEFAKNVESGNKVLTDGIRAQIDDITKYFDSIFNLHTQEITDNYKNIIESVKSAQDSIVNETSSLKSTATEQISISKEISSELLNVVAQINSNKELLNKLEEDLAKKVEIISSNINDNSEKELNSIESYFNSFTDLLNLEKEQIELAKNLVIETFKNELGNVSKNIEKETDIIIAELIEQFGLLKASQADDIIDLTSRIEDVVSNHIYNNIEDLKSYLDIKTDNSVLTNKLDNLKIEMTTSIDEVINNLSKLLDSSVFATVMQDFRATNEILINTSIEKVNNQIIDFISENGKKFEEKLSIFDKKFIDTIIDKFEEVKLLSNNYNSTFEDVQNSFAKIIVEYEATKNQVDNKIEDLVKVIKDANLSTNSEIRQLYDSFEQLRSQISNKSFDEAFQASINKQINSLEALIKEQLGYIEEISSLCENSLPDVTELNTLVKHSILESIKDFSMKLDENNIGEQLNQLKTELVTQIINIFNQVSFVAEQEEILDFIQEKHDELITILSHIVTTTSEVSAVKDSVTIVDNKIESLKDDIEILNEKISAIISADGNIDYVYSLQDLESDIANLRIVLNEMKENNQGKEFSDLISSTNEIYNLVESFKAEIPNKKDFDLMAEDIVSISTRTNKLILASDESYKNLQDNLQDFKLVINDLDERTRNFAQESGMDKIDSKLNALNAMVQNGAKSNQVFNQIFEYLAEWVDNASVQINNISDKVVSLDDIGQIKLMLADLKAGAEDNSETIELVEALGQVFEKQTKRIQALETKLDKIIVESTINNKIDLSPFEKVLNRFLVSIDEKMSLHQAKIDTMESKFTEVLELIEDKDTAQLTKKVGGMDRQIAKLNKSIEKIASHVIEK